MTGESTKHMGQRIKLVGILKDKGILDINVLDAISNIPRHLFMDSAFQNHAYQDKAFPIGENQTISQPYTVAFQTQELKLKKGMKILEIGTGSGYQTAVLCQMGANVFTIERQYKLYRKCLKILPKLGYNPKKIIFGDGYQGYLPQSPYDRIIVTAGSSELPKKLLSQLKIGGLMVIPVGLNIQKMFIIKRKSENEFDKITKGNFRFVPMLKNKN